MQEAIEIRKKNPEQYNRTQRSAVAHGINQRLVFNYQQYFRQPLYLACSYLRICYDRTFHSSNILALQRLGIQLLSIFSMVDTI